MNEMFMIVKAQPLAPCRARCRNNREGWVELSVRLWRRPVGSGPIHTYGVDLDASALRVNRNRVVEASLGHPMRARACDDSEWTQASPLLTRVTEGLDGTKQCGTICGPKTHCGPRLVLGDEGASFSRAVGPEGQ